MWRGCLCPRPGEPPVPENPKIRPIFSTRLMHELANKLPAQQFYERSSLLSGEHGHERREHIRIDSVFSRTIPNCTGFCTTRQRRLDASY